MPDDKYCEHEWVVNPADTDPMEGTSDVICKYCGMPGQRDDRDGSVFWPAT